MNLEWHIRLINRMIEYNPNARIKDYYNIVDGTEDTEERPSVVKDAPREERYYETKKLMGKYSGNFKLRTG